MKPWIRSLAVAIVSLTLLLISTGGCRMKESGVKPPLIVWEPGEWSEASKGQVLKIISDVQEELANINKLGTSQELPDVAIDKIKDLHGKNGFFTAHDGKVHGGAENIKAHLNDNKSHIKKFQIQLKVVCAKEFTDRFNNPATQPEEVVHSLIFIFSSTYEYDGKTVDPLSTATCPHVKLCECRNK